MNSDKARDFFSAYYEQTLDAGLREAFERALASDDALKAEYEAFKRTIDGVVELQSEQIDVPLDLHETISRKLDREIFEQKQSRKPFFLSLRPALVGAAAIAALALTVISINNRDDSSSQAGFITSQGPVVPSLTIVEGELRLFFNANNDTDVHVFDVRTDELLESISVERGQTVNTPIGNSTESAVVLNLNSPEFERSLVVAVPPAQRTFINERRGTGALHELLAKMAECFNRPVLFTGRDGLNVEVEYDLTVEMAYDSFVSLPTGARFNVEIRESGLIVVSR